MGTSGSLTGAGLGSPLIPSWVEDAGADGDEAPAGEKQQVVPPVPMAPKGRLAAARKALGEFASSGDRAAMQRGVGNYVRHGRGGAAMASRRSAGSALRAATLSGIAGGSSALEAVRTQIRDALSANADASELIAAIAAAASPIDGTHDSESGQQSASEALQYVLKQFPDADLLSLDGPQREVVLERFLALDCFSLFYTETGKHMQGKCDLSTAAHRIDEIKGYFCETFRQAKEQRRDAGTPSLGELSDKQIAATCRNIISQAYIIFEAYLDES